MLKNFKVSACCDDCAKKEALNQGIDVKINATQSYNSWINKNPDGNVEDFFSEYTKTHHFKSGEGAFVILEAAVPSKRKRPYTTVPNNKQYSGPTTLRKSYIFLDMSNNSVYVDNEGSFLTVKTLGEAYAMAKSLTKSDKTDVKIFKVGLDAERDPYIGKVVYTPTKGTKNGQYIIFGNVAD